MKIRCRCVSLVLVALSPFFTRTAHSAVLLTQSGNDLIINITADLVSTVNGSLSTKSTDEIAMVLTNVYSVDQSAFSNDVSPFVSYNINGAVPEVVSQSKIAMDASVAGVADGRDLVLSLNLNNNITFDGSTDVVTFLAGTYTATGAFASGFVMPDVTGPTTITFSDILNEESMGGSTTVSVTIVPEPSSMMLLALGTAFALTHRKKILGK